MGHQTNVQKMRRTAAAPCNVCHKEPRRPGSGHCKKCADTYHEQQFNQQRLQKRIEAASKK